MSTTVDPNLPPYDTPPPAPAAVADPRVAPTTYVPTEPVHRWKETTAAFATIEFWAMVVGIAGLIVLYNVTDNADLDLWRVCLLSTLIGVAYIISRGLARSGSPVEREARPTRR